MQNQMHTVAPTFIISGINASRVLSVIPKASTDLAECKQLFCPVTAHHFSLAGRQTYSRFSLVYYKKGFTN